MTTIITRVFETEKQAQLAANRLAMRGVPKTDCRIITAGDKAEALMERAKVHPSAMKPYAKRLAAGNAVLVVHATYKPLGAASITRKVLGNFDTLSDAKVTDDFKVAWEPDKSPSILKDHPHMLSVPGLQPRGNVTAAFGVPVLKKPRRKDNLMSGDKRMSRMFWPMKLVSTRKHRNSVISGGRHMSRMFWPTKLISKGHRSKSVIPGGGTPFSRRLGLRTVMSD